MSNLMQGKRGVIMGVANGYSIAWGIAKACAAQGAELAFTYQGDAFKKRVEPLAAEIGVKTYTEPLESSQGKKTRVRAGPFANREAAEKALEKMKHIGVNGVLVTKS